MLEACYERLNDENGIKQLYEYYVAHSDSVADERCIPILNRWSANRVGLKAFRTSCATIMSMISVGKSLHDS